MTRAASVPLVWRNKRFPMSHRFVAFAAVVTAVVAAVSLAPVSIAGQLDGQPNLEGIWTNATITPLERPQEFAGKEFLTEKEAAEYEKQVAGTHQCRAPRQPMPKPILPSAITTCGGTGGHDVVSTRRTSIVVDPPDGRIPPLTPEAQKKAAARAEARRLHPADGPEDRSLADRCIVRGNTRAADASGRLQQLLSDSADSGARRDSHRDDS